MSPLWVIDKCGAIGAAAAAFVLPRSLTTYYIALLYIDKAIQYVACHERGLISCFYFQDRWLSMYLQSILDLNGIREISAIRSACCHGWGGSET